MTRVHGRTVLAFFSNAGDARQAARQIQERDLGQTRISTLSSALSEGVGPRVEDRGPGGLEPDESFFAPGAGLFSSNNLGPLSATVYALGETAAPGSAGPPVGPSGPGDILLTVVTEEDKVPAVVAVIRGRGGSV